ncbi:MAG: hypothetical protein IJW07_03530 [Lentisphaeria bacterium]|nr:hypothetical protein [Lentisphaeria bacterium]
MKKYFTALLTMCFLLCGTLLSAQYHAPVLDLDFVSMPGSCVSITGSNVSLSDRDEIEFLKKGGLRIDEKKAYFTSHLRSDLFDGRTLSGSFRVSFDAEAFEEDGVRKLSFGMFTLALDENRIPSLTFQAKVGDLLGPDFTLRGRTPVKLDTVHCFTFRYSVRERRADFAMDGELQAAAYGFLPLLDIRSIVCGRDFIGTLENVRLYDGSLETEELLIQPIPRVELNNYLTAMQSAADRRSNLYLTNLCRMILQANLTGRSLTVHDWTAMQRRSGELEALSGTFQKEEGLIRDKILTVFTTTPGALADFTPEIMPPLQDLLKRELRLAAAQNGRDFVPFIVYPFSRIPELKFVPGDLKSKEGNVIPASAVRVLVLSRRFINPVQEPHLYAPVHGSVPVPYEFTTDENIVRIDETKRINQFRIAYPDGDVWMECSGAIEPRFRKTPPPTLEHTTMPVPCVSKAFLVEITARAPAGVYTGSLRLLADGRDAGEIPLLVHVLPCRIKEQPADPGNSYDEPYTGLRFPARDVQGYADLLRQLCAVQMKQPAKAKLAQEYSLWLEKQNITENSDLLRLEILERILKLMEKK